MNIFCKTTFSKDDEIQDEKGQAPAKKELVQRMSGCKSWKVTPALRLPVSMEHGQASLPRMHGCQETDVSAGRRGSCRA